MTSQRVIANNNNQGKFPSMKLIYIISLLDPHNYPQDFPASQGENWGAAFPLRNCYFRKGPLRRRGKKSQFILLKGGLATSWPSANQLIGLFNTNYTVVPNNRMVNSSGLPWSSSNNSLQCLKYLQFFQ